MSADRPLVSVLTPTYNGAAFIGETIESVLAQTHEPIELIVVDDASTDDTVAVVESYARKSDRVRLERRSERLGPCRRRNDALDAARGTVLAWLDHDDLWLPDKVRRQLEILDARPEVGLVYTGFEAFDSDTGAPLAWRDRTIEAEGEVLRALFVDGNFVPSITAIFRRSALEQRGLRFRDRDFSFGDDYYLWLALALDWQFARIDDVLVRYRRHAGNESTRLGRTNYHARRAALLDEFVRDFPDARRRLGRSRRRGLARSFLDAAAFELRRGRRLGQARYVARAMAADPAWTLKTLRSQRAAVAA